MLINQTIHYEGLAMILPNLQKLMQVEKESQSGEH